MMLRSYRQVLLRVIRKLKLWRPHVLFSPTVIRVLMGLMRNLRAYRRAHLVPALPPADRAGRIGRGL